MREAILFAFFMVTLHQVHSQNSSCAISAAGQNTAGGVQMTTLNTVAACSSACLQFMTNSTFCNYGFDFNNVDKTCWFSTNATTKQASGIDHYTCVLIPYVQPGTCNSTLYDTNTNNGIAQPQANRLEDCITLCLVSSSCTFGFDWDSKGAPGLRCWFSTTLLTQTATGVSHYYCVAAPNTTPAPPFMGAVRCYKYANSNSPGGVLTQPTVNNVTACQIACYLVNNCQYGFDYVNITNSCWISTSSVLNMNSALGVDHYQCVQPTTIIGGSGGCSWVPTANTNTKGGIGQAAYTTVESCQTACAAQTNCSTFGFDWDPAATPKCWFSTSNVSQPSSGVTHYSCQIGINTSPANVNPETVKTDLCQWSVSTDISVPYGNLVSNATTLETCRSSCRASTSCLIYGFDWNPSNPVGTQCYFSTNQNFQNNIGVQHHFWNCSGCTFTKYIDTFSPGGILDRTAQTVDDCQALCLNSSRCWTYGFDWDNDNPFGEKCWLSNSTKIAKASNVSHYMPTCSVSGNSSTKTAPPDSNCAWKMVLDKHTRGGILISNATNLTICQGYCMNTTTCNTLGLDWDVSQPKGRQCYLSTTADLFPAINVAHYSFSCVATAPTTRAQACKWVSQPNFQTIGGIKNSASTLKACQDECEKLSSCYLNGIDFVPGAPSDSKCWLSTNNVLTSVIGVDHWFFSCASTCRYPPICTDHQNSPGGILKAEAQTEEECRDLCLIFRTQCINYGYDWVANGVPGTQCWLSTNSNLSNLTYVKHCSFIGSLCSNHETSPGVCNWQSNIDKNSPGGTLVNVTDLEDCQSVCLSSSSCKQYGFDWVILKRECWISNNEGLGSYNGVTHYTYVCNTGPPVTAPNCIWNTQMNTNSPGGIVQPNYKTEEQCRAGCAAATSTCAKYGYDFNIQNSIGSQCWYSTTSSVGTLYGCTHNTYTCKALTEIPTTQPSPSCIFTELPNINSPGGTLVPSATSVDSCKAACAANVVRCSQFGFDWNVKDRTCFLSTSTITSNTVDVTHFNYICSSSCTWVHLVDSNSPGGVLQPAALSLGQCQSLCGQNVNTTCRFGFDWDSKAPIGSQCWFSTSTTTASFPGVNHYTCSGSSTTASTTSAVSLSSRCGWNEYPGRILTFPAGDPMPAITTKSNCFTTCVGTLTCKAYGWRPNNVPPLARCTFFSVTTLPDKALGDNSTVHAIYFC